MKTLPSRPIIAIGLVSLFINISSTIIYAFIPGYLTATFAITAGGLGILEGFVEMLSMFCRVFSGLIADFLQKRKPILLVAYIAITVTKPILAIANSINIFYASRAIEKAANGLQATAREALVSNLANKGERGAAYGLRYTLGVVGSLLGGVIALYYCILMLSTSGNSNNILNALQVARISYESMTTQDYQNIFYSATLPATIGVLVLIFFIKETNNDAANKNTKNHFRDIILPMKLLFNNNSKYWQVVMIAALFTLGTYSGFIAILRAKTVTGDNFIAPIIMIFQNLGGVLITYPTGYYADKGHDDQLLIFGFALAIISNLLYTYANNNYLIIVAALFWGCMMGITQSIFAAKIADSTEQKLRGSAFGLYYLITGVILLLANTIMGKAFELYGANAFFVSSGFIILSLITLMIKKLTKIS